MNGFLQAEDIYCISVVKVEIMFATMVVPECFVDRIFCKYEV